LQLLFGLFSNHPIDSVSDSNIFFFLCIPGWESNFKQVWKAQNYMRWCR
jgi:hypothetical protein